MPEISTQELATSTSPMPAPCIKRQYLTQTHIMPVDKLRQMQANLANEESFVSAVTSTSEVVNVTKGYYSA